MRGKIALLAVLPLMAVCSSCTGKSGPRKLITGYTGDLVGEYKQSKTGSSVTVEGKNIKDQKFVFSIKITAQNNVIKSIGWNTDQKDLLYVKNTWKPETRTAIETQSDTFFSQFVDKKFEDVYYELIAHDDIRSEDGETILYPKSSGSTVRFDALDFAKGSNSSIYKQWTKESPAEGQEEIYDKGLLVEIGAIMSIYHAITK